MLSCIFNRRFTHSVVGVIALGAICSSSAVANFLDVREKFATASPLVGESQIELLDLRTENCQFFESPDWTSEGVTAFREEVRVKASGLKYLVYFALTDLPSGNIVQVAVCNTAARIESESQVQFGRYVRSHSSYVAMDVNKALFPTFNANEHFLASRDISSDDALVFDIKSAGRIVVKLKGCEIDHPRELAQEAGLVAQICGYASDKWSRGNCREHGVSSLAVYQRADGYFLVGNFWGNSHQHINLPFRGGMDLYGQQSPEDRENGSGGGLLRLRFDHPIYFDGSSWTLGANPPSISHTFGGQLATIDLAPVFNLYIAPVLTRSMEELLEQ
jgi:hypothetical protein